VEAPQVSVTPVAVAFDATRLVGAVTADMEDCMRVTVADADLVGSASETAVTVTVAGAGRLLGPA